MFGPSLSCSLDLIRETRARVGTSPRQTGNLTVPVIAELRHRGGLLPDSWYRVFSGGENSVGQVGGALYFWARATVRDLEALRNDVGNDPSTEVNLATRVVDSATNHPLSLTSILNQSASAGNARVHAVFIDSADLGACNLPNLTVLSPNSVATTPSAHAQAVMEVFGNEARQALKDIHLVFSPVVVPQAIAASAALKIFEYNSAVELLAAAKLVSTQYANSKVPVITNVSQGTHGGSHDGQSGLDRNVSSLVNAPQSRFVIAAAGNYGSAAVHSILRPAPGIPSFTKLKVGSKAQSELFIEFWWDSGHGSIDIEALVKTNSGSRRINSQSATSQTTMSSVGSLYYEMVQGSNAFGPLTCICFGLVEMNAQPLSDVSVEFTVRSGGTSAIDVHAWLIGSAAQSEAYFVQSSAAATVTSPATAHDTIAVGAQDRRGDLLVTSSRGIDVSNGWLASPKVPTLVGFGGNSHKSDLSTSYAAPRAAARLAVQGLNGTFATTVEDAICDILGIPRGTNLSPWSPDIGHGRYP